MTQTTKEQIVSAASSLLDAGGQAAVTLRAVADRVGVSHNAPYRHFRDRSSLLAAVAEGDLHELRRAFERCHHENTEAETALRQAAAALIDYGREHKARYRLLFSDPGLVPDENLASAAMGSFQAFSLIVSRCQEERVLPPGDATRLTGLIYATLHGAIDLDLGGRSSGSKGLGDADVTIGLLFELLRRVDQKA